MVRHPVATALCLVVAATLAGCSALAAEPKGLTDAEVEQILLQDSLDRLGSYGLSLEQVAVVFPIRLTTADNYSTTQVDCLNDAGLSAREVSGGFEVSGSASSGAGDGRVAMWVCSSQYPRDPRSSGYLSDAQALYLYDYFSQRLAPCLQLNGYPVSSAPDRVAWIGHLRAGTEWNPYFYDSSHPIVDTLDTLRDLNLVCPPPPGEAFASFLPLDWMRPSAEGTGGL